MIRKNINIDLRFTPEELATEFANMVAEDQADFFNMVAQVSGEWRSSFAQQLQGVTDCENLNAKGRKIMEQIGEYSQESARSDTQ
jgi:hypothetical protein